MPYTAPSAGPKRMLTCTANIKAAPPATPAIPQASKGVMRFELISSPQIDGLHDVSREEQFNHPVHQYSDLALQTRQFAEIDTAPQQPCREPAESHRFLARKGNGKFRTRGMMPHHAQCAERIEVKGLKVLAPDGSADISRQRPPFA